MTAEQPIPPAAAIPTNTNNANIWAFLDYFCALKSAPNYAVLIKGAWGSGKTHLVKQFFAARPALKILYVSLYGLVSIADIENAFFSQLHPWLSSRTAKIGGAAIKAVLRHAKFDVDVFTGSKVEAGEFGEIKPPKFLADAGDRILVFDDLERCNMPLKEVLGYVNAFVEHDGSKVILIGDEDKIQNPDDKELTEQGKEYRDTKEKLIGKTFSIKADFPGAFEGFVAAVEDSDIRQFFSIKRGDIETIFKQSEKDNLRILRQTMLDFERLTSVMQPVHRRHIEALGDIMPPYFALSFEMKAGRVSRTDITKFGTPDWRALLNQNCESPRSKTGARYPEVKFENSILGMDVLRDALFDSAIDAELIRERMARSKYFTTAEDEPAWRALWYAMSRPEDQAQAAVDTVERQFRERVFTDQGELLHVFGERLWLSRIGAISLSIADVVRECKSYVDELYADKKLNPAKSIADVLGNTPESYAGLGFMEREQAAFDEVAKHLSAVEQRAAEDQYPAKAEILLQEMATDTDLFVRRLCITNSADNIYAQIPILLVVSPEKFVARVMGLEPERRRTALIAFSQRYSFLNITPKLVPEVEWLGAVEALLQKEVAKLPPIAKYALNGALARYVTVPLQAAKQQAKALSPP